MAIARQLAFLRAELGRIRPTIDPETRGTQIKAEIASLEQEQQDLGCIKQPRPDRTLAATLTGFATIWTDSSLFPGPKTKPVTVPVTFEEFNHAWRVVVASVALPAFGSNPPVNVTIESGSGDFTTSLPAVFRRMAMDVLWGLHVAFDIAGTTWNGDTSIDTSTGFSILPPPGPMTRGSIDGSGNVVLVGTSSLTVSPTSVGGITANVWLEMQGTLSDFPKST
jgi:hypothetical protein